MPRPKRSGGSPAKDSTKVTNELVPCMFPCHIGRSEKNAAQRRSSPGLKLWVIHSVALGYEEKTRSEKRNEGANEKRELRE